MRTMPVHERKQSHFMASGETPHSPSHGYGFADLDSLPMPRPVVARDLEYSAPLFALALQRLREPNPGSPDSHFQRQVLGLTDQGRTFLCP